MKAISPGEKDLVTIVENLIDKTKRRIVHSEIVSQCLDYYTLQSVFRFAKQSSIVAAFFKSNPKISSYWSKRLFELNCFNEKIIMMNGVIFSTYDQLYSIYQYQENKTGSSTEGHSLQALSERIPYLSKQLSDFLEIPAQNRERDDEIKLEALCDVLSDDAENCMQRYWALGAIRAGLASFNIADFYAEKPEHTLQIEHAKTSTDMYPEIVKNALIKSCRYFYVAKLLETVYMSYTITRYYYSEKGVFAETEPHFISWGDDFENYLNRRLSSFNCSIALRQAIKKQAFQQATEIVNKSKAAFITAKDA